MKIFHAGFWTSVAALIVLHIPFSEADRMVVALDSAGRMLETLKEMGSFFACCIISLYSDKTQ